MRDSRFSRGGLHLKEMTEDGVVFDRRWHRWSMTKLCVLLLGGYCLTATVFGQNGHDPRQAEPVPYRAPVEPADKPYFAAIQLTVDLTSLVDHVQHISEHIPVKPGSTELVLLYPQWVPGEHSPTGTISRLAGIITKVDGRRVQWTRDPIDMYTFHVPVTAGGQVVDLDFDYLSPIRASEGRVEMSDAIATIEWNEVLMYPAGHFARDILFDVDVKIPEGWKYATALEKLSLSGSRVKFQRTPLDSLIDSPFDAGAYFKRIDISPTASNLVHFDIFADRETGLDITPDELNKHKQLAIEVAKLFGSHHYDHYDFLLLLSDKVGGAGIEHHQSSANGAPANYFTDWNTYLFGLDFLAHEYVHSWNGKFRCPADLWVPNFNVPMRNDLLWVYEGLTQYWGDVISARSGMRTPAETRDILAGIAANFEISAGRTWRPLVDTTSQPIISERRPVSFPSWQRQRGDYYLEAELIWLEVDTTIRKLSHETKSLDDFAKGFFGEYNGTFGTQTYTFEELVKVLNSIVPYDWVSFFRERIYEVHPSVPDQGLIDGGYKLLYTDTIPPWLEESETRQESANFSTSLGFTISLSGGEAQLQNVWWQSAAFKAGITPNMRLVSVNGRTFTVQALRAAILEAEHTHRPLQLLFHRNGQYINVAVAYFGGLRVPSLERTEMTLDRLDEILAPSKSILPAT